METKKPVVKLLGMYGDGIFLIRAVIKALLKAGLQKEAEEFVQKATASDYVNLLKVVSEYVEVVE